MLEGIKQIEKSTFVTDIVRNDYRTATVFKKHDIDFCCGGKLPLEKICDHKNLNVDVLLQELKAYSRDWCPSGTHEYRTWKPDFLTDYIVHIHHRYLEKSIPETSDFLDHLTKKHSKKYTHLPQLQELFNGLAAIIIPQIKQEEEVTFPYIKQLTRAYHNKESYAGLLVRTLRKPVEYASSGEQRTIESLIGQIRELTQNYTPPENACMSHQVTLKKLLELDNDTVQHIYLEQEILYPQVLTMETELMNREE